jgi:FKBP-type peptidyl-prolyl cis-trans isomerase
MSPRKSQLIGLATLVITIGIIAGVFIWRARAAHSPKKVTNQEVSKLQIEDLKVGDGDEAIDGKKLTVNYKGMLTNGTQFDSSYDRSKPFQFTLGNSQVIQGWEQGFKGMKVGGKRKLTIPPDLGYGSSAQGSIPPNSTLIFEVELLNVE